MFFIVVIKRYLRFSQKLSVFYCPDSFFFPHNVFHSSDKKISSFLSKAFSFLLPPPILFFFPKMFFMVVIKRYLHFSQKLSVFYCPASKNQGHIVSYRCPSFCPSLSPSPIAHSVALQALGIWDYGVIYRVICQMTNFKTCRD